MPLFYVRASVRTSPEAAWPAVSQAQTQNQVLEQEGRLHLLHMRPPAALSKQ